MSTKKRLFETVTPTRQSQKLSDSEQEDRAVRLWFESFKHTLQDQQTFNKQFAKDNATWLSDAQQLWISAQQKWKRSIK